MPKETILHIAPTPFFSDRGCHIRIEGIVRCLDNLGYNNLVCTYHHGRDVEIVKTRRIGNIKNYTKTEAGPSKYKLWADIKLLILCLSTFRQLKPKFIHAHLHEGLLIGILVKIIFFWHKTTLIADMQGSLTGELEAHGSFKKLPILKAPVHLIERILMWFPNHIFCSSQQSLDKLKDEFNINPKRISLTQDGADPAPKLTSNALRKELRLPLDTTIVLYSGALLDSKGLDVLKQLILEQKSMSKQLHYLIVGYPIENIQPFLESNQLQSLCTLTGQVPFERLAEYTNLADIAIDPKRADSGEGSGKMLNYLAAGLPVVAFENDNNRLFLGDSSPLAKSIEEMLEQLTMYVADSSLRNKQAELNLEHFKQNFSWEVCESQLKSFYD